MNRNNLECREGKYCVPSDNVTAINTIISLEILRVVGECIANIIHYNFCHVYPQDISASELDVR